MPLQCQTCQHVFDDFDSCPQCGSQAVVRLRKRSPMPLIIVTLVGFGVAAILVPNFIRARARGQLTACNSNLKNIGTGLEMYSTDNNGHFPRNLNMLTPNYLRMIPTCPAGGLDTYSHSYQVHADPDAYTVYCSGLNHRSTSLPSGYPQYSSRMGLIEGF